jgi:PhnB protein
LTDCGRKLFCLIYYILFFVNSKHGIITAYGAVIIPDLSGPPTAMADYTIKSLLLWYNIPTLTTRKDDETMQVTPYLYFNGNCAEAIALYEKAFSAASEVMHYGDEPADAEFGSPPGCEHLIMHARLRVGEQLLAYLCDMPPNEKSNLGDALNIHVELDEEAAKNAFETLKDGGNVTMELQKVFWAKGAFGSLVDKFGVSWMIEY